MRRAVKLASARTWASAWFRPGASTAPRAFSSSCCDGEGGDAPKRYTKSHEVVTKTHAHGADGSRARATYAVALSDRAFDLIGDAERMAPVAATGVEVKRGETVAHIRWTGFERTAGDELYHAKWANSSGTREVSAPFSGTVVRYNIEALKDPYRYIRGPEAWLFEMEAAADAAGELLSGSEYESLCEDEYRREADEANASYP
jgi:glycine cleavage system H lipoate-binding protein